MTLFLRRIEEGDRRLLFEWANDPEVRENAINSDPIDWTEHVNWFEAKLNDPAAYIFILEKENVPVGQIRFDKEGDYFKLDYLIDRKFRGQGLGKKIVELGIGKIKEKIKAWVKKENIASSKVLEDLGFRQEKTTKEGLIQYFLDTRENEKKMKSDLHIRRFSELTESQIKNYHKIRYSDFVHNNFGGSKPSLENHLKWFHSAATSDSYRGFGALLGEELIGGFSLKNISTLNESAEFDIFLDREATGQGFAKTMMAKLLETGFRELELHRVYAFLLEKNDKALAVYLKLGFSKEGILRENVKKNNEYHNSIAISILKHEYEGDNKSA